MLTNIFTTFIVASSFGAFSLTVLSSHRPPYISLSHFFKTIKFDETSNSNDWKQCFSKCAPLQGIHWIGLTEFHIVKSFHWNCFLPERPHKRLPFKKEPLLDTCSNQVTSKTTFNFIEIQWEPFQPAQPLTSDRPDDLLCSFFQFRPVFNKNFFFVKS